MHYVLHLKPIVNLILPVTEYVNTNVVQPESDSLQQNSPTTAKLCVAEFRKLNIEYFSNCTDWFTRSCLGHKE